MPSPSSRLAALRTELPLLLGLAAASVLILRPGVGWFYPEGVDWEQYLDAAAYMAGVDRAAGFPPWRQPLHAYLLAVLGQEGSYLGAAQALGLGSTWLMVLAAGLLARGLAGPGAGAAAALVAACMGSTALAARLVTPYPLLGACGGLALALGVGALRWRRWPLALLAGLAGAAAWATDLKGALFIPLSLALVLAGLLRPGGGWRRGALLVLAWSAGAAGPVALDHWLERGWGLQPVPLSEQVRSQREQNLDRMSDPGLFPPALRAACAEEEALEPTVSAMGNGCARAMLRANLDHMAAHRAFPRPSTLWLLPLVLLPAPWLRGSRRGLLDSSLASALALVVPLASGLLAMLWISHGVRYVLHLVVPAAALVPVALARLAGLAAWHREGWAARAAVAAALGAVAWLLWMWPGYEAGRLLRLQGPNLPASHPPTLRSPDPRLGFVQRLAQGLAAGDGVVDCASISVRSFLLPARPAIEEVLPHDLRRCQERVLHPPPGRGTWLVTRHVPEDPGRRWAMEPGFPSLHGWTRVARVDARPHDTPWPGCCDTLILWFRAGQGERATPEAVTP